MKTSLITLAFLLLNFCNVLAQSHWMDMHSLSLPNSRFEDMYFINSQTGYVIGQGKVFKTIDGGKSFIIKDSSQSYLRSIGFFDENTGFIGTLTNTDAMLRTTNGGNNWTKITNINGTQPRGICGISVVNSTTAYGVGVYYCPAFILKTTDKGESWTSLNVDTLKIKSAVDCYFWSADSGIVVGGYNPANDLSVSSSVVLFTSDGGKSFTQVFKSKRTGEWCWKISFVNKLTGFVSVESENRAVILKTTNGGMNWSDNVLAMNSRIQGIGFINENTGWIGGGLNSFMTTNSGVSWAQVPWGHFLNRFRFINDTLGFTIGTSFYKYTKESVGINQISSEVPHSFVLYQNYPNPFNPSTQINYELIHSGFVSIKVYDATGIEIGTLVNKSQKIGIYSIKFDGSNLPSGIYFYKLKSGDITETRKMVLLK